MTIYILEYIYQNLSLDSVKDFTVWNWQYVEPVMERNAIKKDNVIVVDDSRNAAAACYFSASYRNRHA